LILIDAADERDAASAATPLAADIAHISAFSYAIIDTLIDVFAITPAIFSPPPLSLIILFSFFGYFAAILLIFDATPADKR
jgi:hypothetical protein